MTVTDGMDTARARTIADHLKNEGAALAGVGMQGGVLMKTLKDVWSGPDVEDFAREWEAARPAIARSSNHLTDAGHELTRQADEQDRTSDADGAPGPAEGGSRRGHPFVTGAPQLPPLIPGFRSSDPGRVWDTVKDVWDTVTSPVFGFVQTVVDEAISKLEDIKKFTWVGKAAKIWGVVGGVASYAFGLWDMGQAVVRFFTEGPSVDGFLQLAEGFFGWVSGGLGIAAIFATGTIFGAPAGLVLGGLALLAGLISLGIGTIREYGPWFMDVIEEDPAWAAKVSQHGGLHHGWELPERNAPIPKIYKASDRQNALGMAGA